MAETKLNSVNPVLAASNIDATEKFYEEKLGFKTRGKYEGYLIMSRGDVSLHFTYCDDKYIAENTSCYVYVTNIEPLYDEYKAAGIVHPNGPLQEHFYGLKEFSVLDADGNLIKFGERLNTTSR